MMHLVLVIDMMAASINRPRAPLRTHLNLKKQGRLTDDWDKNSAIARSRQQADSASKIGPVP